MDLAAIASTLLPTFSAEALKNWGSFAFCLIGLGFGLWRSEKRAKEQKAEHEDEFEALKEERSSEVARLEAEKKSLQDRITQLQDQRLDELRQMIRVTESSTQTAAARAQGDQAFLETMRKSLEAIVDRLEAVEDKIAPYPATAQRPTRPRGTR